MPGCLLHVNLVGHPDGTGWGAKKGGQGLRASLSLRGSERTGHRQYQTVRPAFLSSDHCVQPFHPGPLTCPWSLTGALWVSTRSPRSLSRRCLPYAHCMHVETEAQSAPRAGCRSVEVGPVASGQRQAPGNSTCWPGWTAGSRWSPVGITSHTRPPVCARGERGTWSLDGG